MLYNDSFQLPEIDQSYRITHALDKPFMLYPGETAMPYNDDIIITSYARVFNTNKNKFYNDAQPMLNTYQLSISKQRKIYKINLNAFLKEHFPDSQIWKHERKQMITAADKHRFVEWYDANRERLEPLHNNAIAALCKEETGVDIHFQTVWLHKHPDQLAKMKTATMTEEQREQRRQRQRAYRLRKQQQLTQQTDK